MQIPEFKMKLKSEDFSRNKSNRDFRKENNEMIDSIKVFEQPDNKSEDNMSD